MWWSSSAFHGFMSGEWLLSRWWLRSSSSRGVPSNASSDSTPVRERDRLPVIVNAPPRTVPTTTPIVIITALRPHPIVVQGREQPDGRAEHDEREEDEFSHFDRAPSSRILTVRALTTISLTERLRAWATSSHPDVPIVDPIATPKFKRRALSAMARRVDPTTRLQLGPRLHPEAYRCLDFFCRASSAETSFENCSRTLACSSSERRASASIKCSTVNT